MILVTGASGHLGGEVLRLLSALAPKSQSLYGLAREPAKVQAPPGSRGQLRRGDFAEPASLAAAFAGVETLVLVSIEGADEERLRLHRNAVTAAVRAGVGRIVYTSFLDVSEASPFTAAAVHRLTEQAIRDSGCAYTFLRNGPYVDNFARRIAHAAREGGVYRISAGAARLPFIDRRELALACAHAVTKPRSRADICMLTGPALVSFDELTQLVARATGRAVRYEAVDDETYRGEMQRLGFAPDLITRGVSYAQAMRTGHLTALSDDFCVLTGTAPSPMAQVVPRLDWSPP